jgi:hypothetical protein
VARDANELRSGANSGQGIVAQGHSASSDVNSLNMLSTQRVNVLICHSCAFLSLRGRKMLIMKFVIGVFVLLEPSCVVGFGGTILKTKTAAKRSLLVSSSGVAIGNVPDQIQQLVSVSNSLDFVISQNSIIRHADGEGKTALQGHII